jgi:hypothetical protein
LLPCLIICQNGACTCKCCATASTFKKKKKDPLSVDTK